MPEVFIWVGPETATDSFPPNLHPLRWGKQDEAEFGSVSAAGMEVWGWEAYT